MSLKWFVVHTHPNKELTAREHLETQGFTVFLPRYKKERRHARKVETVLAPLFPRYLFVAFDLEKDLWRPILSTRGVSYLLQSETGTPAAIPEGVVESLQAQEGEDGLVTIESLQLFQAGQEVRVLEGAFEGQTAVFESMDDQKRVHLLLSFLNRNVKVTLPAHLVESLS